MPREQIDKASVRNRLQPRREPYFGAPVERSLWVGFRKGELNSGHWIAKWRDDSGKRHHAALGAVTGTFDYDSACKAARQWKRARESGVQTDRVMTVADVCRDYTAAIEAEGRSRTATDSRKRFDRIVYADAIGKVRADKLTQRHLESWMGRMQAGEMTGRKSGMPSKSTFNRNLTSLKAALNRAVSRREIPQDRAIEWNSIKPHKGADARREEFLDLTQRRALLAAMEGDLRDLAECVVLTGCRPGDPAAMVRKDWDGKTGLATFRTKTGARTVPVSPDARALFDRLAKSKLPAARMFTNNGVDWTPQAWAPLVKRAAAKAGLPAETVLYSLRHAWLTDAITGGMDLATAAHLTGTSLEMISKNYSKLAQDAARDKLASIRFL